MRLLGAFIRHVSAAGRSGRAACRRFVHQQKPDRYAKYMVAQRSKEVPWHGYATALIPGISVLMAMYTSWHKDENWLQEMASRAFLDPEELPTDPDDIEDMEYMRVRIKGKFDHSREMFIEPRVLKTGLYVYSPEEEGWEWFLPKKINKSYLGAYVVTPFKLSDRNEWILVNRGWVHKLNMDPSYRTEGQVTNEVEIVAIVRKSEENDFWFTSNYDSKTDRWVVRDIEGMAKKAKTLPVMVDVCLESSIPGGPIGGQTIIERSYWRRMNDWALPVWIVLFLGSYWLWVNVYIRTWIPRFRTQ